ncbi:NAD(P)-binding protein [Cylindrobasidium torrendii FP15055 ss-10]|uniref:NAD(P)-binding protein n=1 Tax=Cylindrobasidium torrendii FP15055 ss-10 TaxID=1314674 RepID=A0A0D7BM12_9AGAR|nr:NAD(P)-binding protein [Cylindrobasidium torrendii FP15055 ss-10]
MTTGYAILGAGIFATSAYLPALDGISGSELKAVYSRSKKTSETFVASPLVKSSPAVYHDEDGGQGGIDALLARSDISAVLVVLPIPLQPSIVLKALASGKHVISEKPIAKDVATARATIKEYEEKYKPKGLIWRVAENFEAEPAYRAARDWVQEGKIGDVTGFRLALYGHVTKDGKYYKTPWRTIPEYQGGFLLDGGVHQTAALRTIIPAITHVSSYATLKKDYLLPHDTITVIGRGSSNANTQFYGTLDMSFGFPTKSNPGNGLAILGSKGWIDVKFNAGVFSVVLRVVTKETEDGAYEESEETFEYKEEGVAVELKSFLGAVNGQDDGLGLGGPAGALRDVAFIQAALTSNGSEIELDTLE